MHKTQFNGLCYSKVATNHWAFFDCLDQGPAQIGTIYPTKESLLADLHRFATERGFKSN